MILSYPVEPSISFEYLVALTHTITNLLTCESRSLESSHLFLPFSFKMKNGMKTVLSNGQLPLFRLQRHFCYFWKVTKDQIRRNFFDLKIVKRQVESIDSACCNLFIVFNFRLTPLHSRHYQ